MEAEVGMLEMVVAQANASSAAGIPGYRGRSAGVSLNDV
jgi:hypothetical protein